MENNKFDKTLRDKLESLDPQYEASSWDALEGRMDAVEDTAMDEAVREKLESVETPYDAASWAVLQDKMQALEDTELDEVVRERVSKEADDYSSRSWMDLLRRLESWERVRREFWMLRSAEALMIILLLLAVYQYGPLLPGPGETDANSGTASVQDLPVGEDLSTADIYGAPDMGQQTEVHGENSEIRTAGDLTAPEEDDRSSAESTSSDLSNVRLERVTAEQSAIPVDDGIISFHQAEAVLSDAVEKTAGYSETMKEGGQIASNNILPVAFLQAGLSPLVWNTVNDQQAPQLDIPEISTGRRQVWLTLQSHSALNRVHTPKNEEFDARNAYTLGYGMGILVGFTHGKFMWETGVEYQLSLFKPKRTKLTGNISDGYRQITLSEVNLDYINIPLQARYLLHNSGRHELYALGGIKLHISSKVDFDFVEERDVNNLFPVDFSEPPEDVIGVNKGRFTYFSLNAGVGYQYLMNTRTKLFVQPSYEHFAEKNGITNLNGEKVNTYRLDFGVRVRL